MFMRLLLVGCGNLGKVFLKIWLQNNIFTQIVVVQPSLAAKKLFKNRKLQPQKGLMFIKTPNEIPNNFKPDFVVFAAKPQVLPDILQHYRHFPKAIYISLATAISTAFLRQKLGGKTIVRVMPNVAAQIGASINLAYVATKLSRLQKNRIAKIFAPTGKLIWLKEDKLIDLLTAVAGSGAAYVFLFIQSLVKTAIKLGLDEETANTMVKQVVLGGAMLAQQDIDLGLLIASVASKGGLTEAALSVLQPRLFELVDKACITANKRLKTLQK